MSRYQEPPPSLSGAYTLSDRGTGLSLANKGALVMRTTFYMPMFAIAS
jgi:hypothetical protein